MVASVQLGLSQIRSGAILLALLALRNESAAFYAEVGGEVHKRALEKIAAHDLAGELPDLVVGSSEGKAEAAAPAPTTGPLGAALQKFTVSLNQQARDAT
jgi:hypothetical protein